MTSGPSGHALRNIALGTVAIGGIGTVAAAALAADDEWLQRAISALTVDPAAAGLFRATMALVAIGMAILSVRVAPIVDALRAAGLANAAASLIAPGIAVIALGFAGVALFPVDGPPWMVIAHGTAAYAPAILLLVGMLTARVAVPALGDRFGRASLVLLAGILGLYLAAVAALLPWGLMELLAFLPAGAWLVVFVDRLERLAGGLGTAVPSRVMPRR